MIRPGARPQPYDRHVGRYGARLARQLIAAADVAPEQPALDVGCGFGALAIELARALGEEGVAAIDPSKEATMQFGHTAPNGAATPNHLLASAEG